MKIKFWGIYLCVVALSLSVAYMATSNESDVPLVLSNAQMEHLYGAGEVNWVCEAVDPCAPITCNENELIQRWGSACNSCTYDEGETCTWEHPTRYCDFCVTRKFKSECGGEVEWYQYDNARACD